MRFAYLKFGDVVEELRAIGPRPSAVSSGGPGAFSSAFLKIAGDNESLLISLVPAKKQSMILRTAPAEARLYVRKARWPGILPALRIFFRLLRFRPDVIVCVQDGGPLWASYLASRWLQAAFIHSRQRAVRLAGDNWRRRLIATIDALAIRRASAVICHGPFTRHQLAGIGVAEANIIEFDVGFDDLFAEIRKSEPAAVPRSDGRKRIVFVGRVEATKGVFDLLNASLPLLKTRDDVDLLFIGGGGGFVELSSRVLSEGVSSRVELTGRVPHARIGVLLRSATVLVTPTRNGLEGWPMAALEGLAVGVPVIAPDAGPFPFMIRNDFNGLLFKVNSVDDLRLKMLAIIDNPSLRESLARGAREYEIRRAQSFVSFEQALAGACARSVRNRALE